MLISKGSNLYKAQHQGVTFCIWRDSLPIWVPNDSNFWNANLKGFTCINCFTSRCGGTLYSSTTDMIKCNKTSDHSIDKQQFW